MMNSRVGRVVSRLVALGMVLCFLLPMTAGAAAADIKTPNPQKQTATATPVEERISVFQIALFYAGIIGTVIGMTTGWLVFMLTPMDLGPKVQPVVK